MERAAGWGVARAALRAAGRGGKGRELRDALRLRTASRISDRCLDRTSAQAAVFSAEAKGHRARTPRILRLVFRQIRRLRAAVSVSSCAQEPSLPVSC